MIKKIDLAGHRELTPAFCRNGVYARMDENDFYYESLSPPYKGGEMW